MDQIIEQKEIKEYKTSQLSLTAFLELYGRDQGVRFIKTNVIKDRNGKIKIEFVFSDPNNVCKDLELEFRFSNENKYRTLLFYYKKKISETLGGI